MGYCPSTRSKIFKGDFKIIAYSVVFVNILLQEAKKMNEKEINVTRRLPKQIQARTASKGKKGWRQAEVLLAIQFLKTSGLLFNLLCFLCYD